MTNEKNELDRSEKFKKFPLLLDQLQLERIKSYDDVDLARVCGGEAQSPTEIVKVTKL